MFGQCVYMLKLTSVTRILSFMSEMKHLKLRNIKQLGSSQVGLVGISLIRRLSHYFLIYLSFRAVAPLGQGQNVSCFLLHLQGWAHPRH